MKKLGKLTINLNKVIKNEELVRLRGGDYYTPPGLKLYECTCTHGGPSYNISVACNEPAPWSYAPNCASGYQTCTYVGQINC
jgi:natural product precursor